ncbi:prenyltransferase/squalene oxidase repeat-containing protein [Anatilimnocola floriformis]|uniref:prenyltransferase/squalene oxidase repeat-containing protein n=1 Tax=Anatilimnocola floriformis TaxID=2948575 RepID=UPI0020C40A7B|nr:prenyltransferase/squalene oxidase repeat-containing protein [Anatilimnocola floriformis]
MITAALLILAVCQVHAEAAASFLRTTQQPNGGFISDQPKPGETAKPNLRTTRTAVRVFRLLDKDIPNREKVTEFLWACYDEKSGGFAAEPGGKPDPISTSVGLMIAQELKLPTEKYLQRGLKFMDEQTEGFEQIRMVASSLEEFEATVPSAAKWVREMEAKKLANGSFGEGSGAARQTALFGVAIQRLGGKIDRDSTLRILRAGQRADGGFGSDAPDVSDLESCYRIVRLFHRLEATPERVHDLRGFIARCKKSDGGYGRTTSETSSLHGTYYATIITSWLDELEQADVNATRRRWQFEDVPLDELPKDWTIANALPALSAKWEVVERDGVRGLAQSSSAGAYKQFHLCLSDYRCVNVDIRVRLKAIAGELDQGGGVVWRYTDPKNYYIARWNPLEDNFRVYKVVDGVRSQLDSAKVPHRADWQTLRIVTYGRNIRGYLDGKLLLEAEDDQFTQPGFIGLWTKSDAVTQFADLQVVAAFKGDVEELAAPSTK